MTYIQTFTLLWHVLTHKLPAVQSKQTKLAPPGYNMCNHGADCHAHETPAYTKVKCNALRPERISSIHGGGSTCITIKDNPHEALWSCWSTQASNISNPAFEVWMRYWSSLTFASLSNGKLYIRWFAHVFCHPRHVNSPSTLVCSVITFHSTSPSFSTLWFQFNSWASQNHGGARVQTLCCVLLFGLIFCVLTG